MAKYLVIQLHPEKPVTAEEFKSYLEGLTIEAHYSNDGKKWNMSEVQSYSKFHLPEPNTINRKQLAVDRILNVINTELAPRWGEQGGFFQKFKFKCTVNDLDDYTIERKIEPIAFSVLEFKGSNPEYGAKIILKRGEKIIHDYIHNNIRLISYNQAQRRPISTGSNQFILDIEQNNILNSIIDIVRNNIIDSSAGDEFYIDYFEGNDNDNYLNLYLTPHNPPVAPEDEPHQQCIVIRLHPEEPISGGDFAKLLSPDLSIKVYDLSVDYPRNGIFIGEAKYIAPDTTDKTKQYPDQKGSSIIQHFLSKQTGVNTDNKPIWAIETFSIATAVIKANIQAHEYESVDIRLELSREGSGIIHKQKYYNVSLTKAVVDPNEFIKLNQVSLYLPLPSLQQHTTEILPDDGTVPVYDEIYKKVTDVLTKELEVYPVDSTDEAKKKAQKETEQKVTNKISSPITLQEARHIAYEILWGKTGAARPEPESPFTLKELYTVQAVENKDEERNNRQKFEGDLLSYYSQNNSLSDRLANYVYTLSAAKWCEEQSKKAEKAGFLFPVLLSAPEKCSKVIFDNLNNTAPALFVVPAEYFYVLGSTLPPQIKPQQRYDIAIAAAQEQNISLFQQAVEEGIITDNPDGVNCFQAARTLQALGLTKDTSSPKCELSSGSNIHELVKDWREFIDSDINNFWLRFSDKPEHLDIVLRAATKNHELLVQAIKKDTEEIEIDGNKWRWKAVDSVKSLRERADKEWKNLFSTYPALLPAFTIITHEATTEERIQVFIDRLKKILSCHLALVLCSVTREPQNSKPLADAITKPNFGVNTANDLAAKTSNEWNSLFASDTALLPEFTKPGTTEERIQTFVRHLRKFFDVAQGDTGHSPAARPNVIPSFDIKGLGLNLDDRKSCIEGVLNLTEGIEAPAGFEEEFRFSVAEALWARGIVNAKIVGKFNSKAAFKEALVGSVAYNVSDKIWENAKAEERDEENANNFLPINPDGSLVNCIPPAHLSPFGPVAYLHDLLKVAGSSSCSDPLPMEAGDRLNSLLENRRGALGNLLASKENLEVPLPMIDLVNESLEYMVANNASSGTVHDTAEQDEIGGHDLMKHDPETLLAALPEHSTPADTAAKDAYDKLKNDFSSCLLPYSQALDVSRTYLEAMGTSRFAVMRRFRKEITEFVLAPENESAEFQNHLWRYPIRIETAIEYLKITPEEHRFLFQTEINDSGEIPDGTFLLHQLLGFQSRYDESEKEWTQVIVNLSEFLKRTCLTYCEFLELWKSKFVKFDLRGSEIGFPECESCCLNPYTIQFPNQERPEDDLRKLAIFIRLWRKLQAVPNARYTFAELKNICDVLELFKLDGTINPDFIRQLVAFQMLRDDFKLSLGILGLWKTDTSIVQQLLDKIQQYAVKLPHCCCRKPEFIKLLKENLDSIALLAGFGSDSTSAWYAKPTHTLRFAEILAKIYASGFSIGELLFLFTTQEHLQGDDPFPLQTANEAKDSPFGLPDDQDQHSLWALRQKLLAAKVTESAGQWTWARMESVLRHEFGLTKTNRWNSLGQHFFPALLAASSDQRRYQTSLPATVELMWNTPPDGPFQYDTGRKELWTQIPLTDEAVLAKLGRIRQLSSDEQKAVRDLYFQPRAELARFALLFSSLDEAEAKLIQEPDEAKRWAWFQQQFDLFYCRCQIIAEHLAAHVADASAIANPEGVDLAKLLLKHLWADENFASTTWERDSGNPPDVTWKEQPNGGAFAALLGLTGTGMLTEYKGADDSLCWRDICSSSELFGAEENAWNAPVPTILPTLEKSEEWPYSSLVNLNRYAAVRNGFAMSNSNGAMLGGAEPFTLCWKGLLLIETDGQYGFSAGAPSPAGAMPEFKKIHESHNWRVTLKRGQKEWVLIAHDWPTEEAPRACSAPVELKKGFYELKIELKRKPLLFDGPEDIRPQSTGFQLKYNGPDTGMDWLTISRDKLFLAKKDAVLSSGMEREDAALEFLEAQYISTVRDMRRTYQRTFKAALFVCRLDLSARQISDDGQSELGYLLAHPVNFAGHTYYSSGSAFTAHKANFNFNFLPVNDAYCEPTADQRTTPSSQRQQAMFDWWERVFDYTVMRRETERSPEQPTWLLFHESAERHPDNPADLLRHLGVDLLHDSLVLQYNENYSVTSADLEDDRWAVRCWQAEKWVRGLRQYFFPKDITEARPDLWALNDPAAGTPSGNANLTGFYRNGCIENGAPRRYEDIKRLNDGLRVRGRDALVAYLTHMNRISLPWNETMFAISASQLSELLLQDVQTGLCQKASRIEKAISAVQLFVQRARLGLEEKKFADSKFMQVWDRHFSTFRIWEACKRRELYKENWIEFEQLQEDRQSESFQLLESELRRSTLTMTAVENLPSHPSIPLLSQREAVTAQTLTLNGLTSLITPDRHARLGWLAPAHVEQKEQADDRKEKLPMWMQAAVRQGIQFVRVAAAGLPPASAFNCNDQAGFICCQFCGKTHPPVMDEYYFWIENSSYYAAKEYEREDAQGGTVEQVAEWGETKDNPQSDWHNSQKLPNLLHWNSKSMVHLHWCRIHNGEFQQPRQSYEGIRLKKDDKEKSFLKFLEPKLNFLGRCVDSLFFEVKNGEAPTGFPLEATKNDFPGFRYNILADEAVILPSVEPFQKPELKLDPQPIGITLTAFPFFAWFTPGKPLLPPSTFSPAITVAGHLRTHCRFEPALKWYEQFYNPLARTSNNSWLIDKDSSAEEKEKKRAVLLHYLETMLQWGDALMRKNTPESFQQARLIFETADKILGAAPANTIAAPQEKTQNIKDFKPQCAPINPRLMCLYTSVSDRLTLVHNCLNAKRLKNGRANLDMPYFGNSRLRDCWKNSNDLCADEDEWCLPQSPYRFMVLLQKAQELTGDVRALGGALLSAYEKGDGEYLSTMRTMHERQLLNLALEVRQYQWREADWQVQGLRKTKEIAQTRLRYYKDLIAAGLISGEAQYEPLTISSTTVRSAGNVAESIAQLMNLVPDPHVGAPCNFAKLPPGSKMAEIFSASRNIANTVADILNTVASLGLTKAGWDRREQEWKHQVDVLTIEIEQIERQILAAERRRDIALRELNNHQQQMENAAEVHDFLRDKFTSHALYLWMQQETAAMYYQMYELALHCARQAQRAFNFERGSTAKKFIPAELWDNLREGLLSGERLQSALRHMEKAYYDENVREYELTKHISLRLHFPEAFLQLRTTGFCEIELPEWLFDLDYPGHYMRRIKSVTLTVPCVAGPYTGIHCHLTLLSSKTRIAPTLVEPPHACCKHTGTKNGYQILSDDPRIVSMYTATDAIATSGGQNDSGMFELNFRDERYLPFEFSGAVSRWRVELPPENNRFDMESLSDFVVHLNYTAREGGDVLRAAAQKNLLSMLPDNGIRLLDVRRDLGWIPKNPSSRGSNNDMQVGLRISRMMFPYLAGNQKISVNGFEILIEASDAKPRKNIPLTFFALQRIDGLKSSRCRNNIHSINCVGDSAWPGFYRGVFNKMPFGEINTDGWMDIGVVQLPKRDEDVRNVYLLISYSVVVKDGRVTLCCGN